MNTLKHALRQLLKSPGFTAIAVLVLALGIGANTAIFSLINAFLFRPLVALQPERLAGVYSRDVEREFSWRAFSIPNFLDLRRQNEVFTDVFAMFPSQVGFTEGETTRRVFSLTVSANCFDVFGVHPRLGRAFLPEEDTAPAPVVIVSHPWWERHGADPGILGRTLRINGRACTVVGVTPPGFSGTTPMFSPEFYFPLGSTLLAVGVAFALGNLRVDVPRFDPVVLIVAPGVLGAASMVACWLPARRASRVDPMEALRAE